MTVVRIGVSLLVLVLALPAGAAQPSEAGQERPGLDIGILGGFIYVDEDLAGPDGPTTEPTLGARIGGPFFAERLRWFVDAQYYRVDTRTFRLDASAMAIRSGGEISFFLERLNPMFLSLGLGYTRLTFDNATDYSSGVTSLGIGQRVWAGGDRQIRWELRADHNLASDGLMGADVDQLQFLIGFGWTVRSKPKDRDGDGIVDRLDVCPGSLPGETVDYRGCPLVPRPAEPPSEGPPAAFAPPPPPDRDGDGVPDASDACPGTVRGVEVDQRGCALDADEDGVYDGLGMDRCPDTPRGALVDAHGCPLDGDGDGVYDGLDRCPDSAPGAEVGEDGCPAS